MTLKTVGAAAAALMLVATSASAVVVDNFGLSNTNGAIETLEVSPTSDVLSLTTIRDGEGAFSFSLNFETSTNFGAPGVASLILAYSDNAGTGTTVRDLTVNFGSDTFVVTDGTGAPVIAAGTTLSTSFGAGATVPLTISYSGYGDGLGVGSIFSSVGIDAQAIGGTLTATPVPLPAGMALALGGLGALVAVRRRRRAA